jgi:hypothetical protein
MEYKGLGLEWLFEEGISAIAAIYPSNYIIINI